MIERLYFRGSGGAGISGDVSAPEDPSRAREIVIIQHGIFFDRNIIPAYHLLFSSLSAGKKRIVAFYDMRGHGESCRRWRSDEIGDYFDPQAAVRDVSLAIDFLLSKFGLGKGTKVTLIGHSFGGYIVLRAAARDKRVGKVVAISAPVSFRFSEAHALDQKVYEELLVELPHFVRDRLGVNKDGPMSVFSLKGYDFRSSWKKRLEKIGSLESYAAKFPKRTAFIDESEDYFPDLFDSSARKVRMCERFGFRRSLLPTNHAFLGSEKSLVKAVLKAIER